MKRNLLLVAIIALFSFGASAQFVNDDFQDGDINGWLTVAPTFGSYSTTWHLGTHETESYLRASSYSDGTTYETEQWVVSPLFDASGVTSLKITFDNRLRYSPANDLKVFVSTDFAGDSASFGFATWNEVTGFTLDTYNGSTDYDWAIGATANAAITGSSTTYIAFKYTSGSGGPGGVWDVDNVVVRDAASGISLLSSGTKIYPNPTSNILNISSKTEITNIEVISVIGQKVLSISNNSKTAQINTENLVNGVYFVKLTDANGNNTISKIVKK